MKIGATRFELATSRPPELKVQTPKSQKTPVFSATLRVRRAFASLFAHSRVFAGNRRSRVRRFRKYGRADARTDRAQESRGTRLQRAQHPRRCSAVDEHIARRSLPPQRVRIRFILNVLD